MAGSSEAKTDAVAVALGYVCRRLDYLRTSLPHDNEEDPPVLRELLDCVRTGKDLRGPLEALHNAARRAGDALGVWGYLRNGLHLSGVSHDAPIEVVYLCPGGHCNAWQPGRGDTLPLTCAISGARLRRERL